MKTLAKWSVDDYHRMVEAGILRDRHLELLAGEIVEMSPETPIHYTTAKRSTKYLEGLLSGKADVRFNGPITLSDSEPEPDIAIVQLPESSYSDHHPAPQDMFWYGHCTVDNFYYATPVFSWSENLSCNLRRSDSPFG
ncbi:Uma2 family endonuclease [Nostoc sp.]|uniref:Uma2 family endonuclease n=1 Tax=Nostoc sp. TaxID=1180 RepID=UPI002FFD2D17